MLLSALTRNELTLHEFATCCALLSALVILDYLTARVNYILAGAHGVRTARGLGNRGRRGLPAEGGRHVPVSAREHGRPPGDLLQAVRGATACLAGNILCTCGVRDWSCSVRNGICYDCGCKMCQNSTHFCSFSANCIFVVLFVSAMTVAALPVLTDNLFCCIL
jgi:hypothetical protein